MDRHGDPLWMPGVLVGCRRRDTGGGAMNRGPSFKVGPTPRDVNVEEIVSECEKCQGEIYTGGLRFVWAGRWICPNCFRYAVRKVLWENPEEIALEMGVEVERYE